MLYEGTTVVAGSRHRRGGRDRPRHRGRSPTSGRSTTGPRRAASSARLARLSAVTTLPFAALGSAWRGASVRAWCAANRCAGSLGAGREPGGGGRSRGAPHAGHRRPARRPRAGLSVRGALVREPPRHRGASGRAEVLCTDKTGTLTEGRISLQTVRDGTRTYAIDSLDDHAHAIAGGRPAGAQPRGHGEGSPRRTPPTRPSSDGAGGGHRRRAGHRSTRLVPCSTPFRSSPPAATTPPSAATTVGASCSA